jgi:hypothetical protein
MIDDQEKDDIVFQLLADRDQMMRGGRRKQRG